jgi:hypothetical protein
MIGLLRIVAAIAAAFVAISNIAGQAFSQPVEASPLQLEAKIPLGDVRGRIDTWRSILPASGCSLRSLAMTAWAWSISRGEKFFTGFPD